MTSARKLAYAALLGNMILWGLAIPIAKRGFADGLTPGAFLLGRYLLATLCSLPIIIALRRQEDVKTTFSLKNLLTILSLEILGTVIALRLLYEGVARTTAVEASLIAVTWPILVTLGGIFFLKEREERHEILGLILAVVGTFLLVIKPLLHLGSDGNVMGNLLIVGQNLTIAAYYLLAKKFYAHLNKWAVTHVSFWVGIIGFSSSWQSLGTVMTAPSAWPLIAIVYMALAGSILGLTLYLIGQDKIEASEAALFTYLEPLVGIPASLLLLGESITLVEILGALVIALGVYLAERRPRSIITS